QLNVKIADSEEELGLAAAEHFAAAIRDALAAREETAVLLATGNSQRSFREAIIGRSDIEWSRITVLHVDEYLGIAPDGPSSTAWRMYEDFVKHVRPKEFFGLKGDHVPAEDELARYSGLVEELDP